ncbi:MAG: peptide-methionine (S)-S-oxide reductase MsrA [Pseudomonadota bacterium]
MTHRWNLALAATVGVAALAIAGLNLAPSANSQTAEPAPMTADVPDGAEVAIFAGGCFWCVEKDFDHVTGVLRTTSGYIGGQFPNPTYQNHGANGDLEAVEVVYDPDTVTYSELAHTFFRTVDPLDDGGQFCDRGNSYRTAIFVLDADQRALAETAAANASSTLGRDVATRIIDAPTFWPAEEYHQDYYQKNPLRYQFYRTSCGRNRTVERVWGEEAYAGVDN